MKNAGIFSVFNETYVRSIISCTYFRDGISLIRSVHVLLNARRPFALSMLCKPREKQYETLDGEKDAPSSPPASTDDADGVKGAGGRRGQRGANRSRERGSGEPGTVLCPTCDGHGKVPKEKEKNLLALIPADDDRLKVITLRTG